MSATTRRLSAVTEPYTVIQPTQRWLIVDGEYYRETVVQAADGQRRIYAIRDAA